MTSMNLGPSRGCGTLKPGGFYLQGEMSMGGMLRALVYLFGTHIAGQVNLHFDDVSERSMTIIHPAASLVLGEVIPWDADFTLETDEQEETYKHLLKAIGPIALLDYVGKSYYTPEQFMRETINYGASRRVNPDFAEQIAKFLPLPIIFVHDDIPVFPDEEAANQALKVSSRDIVVGKSMEPVWLHPEFGMWAGGYYGLDHYLLPILSQYERLQESDVPFSTHRMAFCASWMTSSVYVPKSPDDDRPLPALVNRFDISGGLDPVVNYAI